MTDLSPAAAAVLTAYHKEAIDYIESWGSFSHKRGMAAALRAAVDQVVPQPPMLVEGGRTYEEAWTATVHEVVRRQLLAIAAELYGTNPANQED